MTDPQEPSPTEETGNGQRKAAMAFIFLVTAREVIKQADAATRLDGEVNSQTNSNKMVAYMGWLAARTEAAKVEQLYKGN